MEQDDPVRDPEYLESLSRAVSRGVAYGIEVLAVGEEKAGDIPVVLTAQARLAARNRIPLELVIRRYLAAKLLLSDFLLEEASEIEDCSPPLLRAAMAAQAAAFERLLASATDDYLREIEALPRSHEARLVALIKRLLAGEMVDASPLGYELSGHHLGICADSPGARPTLERLADDIGARSLIVSTPDGGQWAWLGGTVKPVDPTLIHQWLDSEDAAGVHLGLGESKTGRDGWRLTHEQARTAVWVAKATSSPLIEYTKAALLGSMGRDALLTTSLREKYLLPLANARDGGEVIRTTLRAYFETDRNSSSAAAALGVSRQTVANRLRIAERQIGEPLKNCADILYAALRLEELQGLGID